MLKKWEELPENIKTEEVRKYYDILKKKHLELVFKRVFDIVISFILLFVLSPAFLILAIVIKLNSKGPVFFRQIRVTQYGKQFKIIKFRSMVIDAELMGTQFTVDDDNRVTKVGSFIRKTRIDEIPQLLNILQGTMTFVGTRPEVLKYGVKYTTEMMATLLLPAGVTSLCSIYYKDEDKLINTADDIDNIYTEYILPEKMKYNLKAIEEYSFWKDIKIIYMTVLTVCGKEYKDENSVEPIYKKNILVPVQSYMGGVVNDKL